MSLYYAKLSSCPFSPQLSGRTGYILAFRLANSALWLIEIPDQPSPSRVSLSKEGLHLSTGEFRMGA
jgi:hypothetical protein